MKNLYEKLFKKHFNLTMTVIFGVVAALLVTISGITFKEFANYKEFTYLAPNVEKTRLSDYYDGLKGTTGDTDVYVIKGTVSSAIEDGSMLILGGTHPNEVSGHVAATMIAENLKVEVGTVYVIPTTDASGFNATSPQDATNMYYNIKLPNGGNRTFKFGARSTAILDQWPVPDVYVHSLSGMQMSGGESRNLNRAYPGRTDGSFTERITYGIAELIRQQKIKITIDLHEASPEYNININSMTYFAFSPDCSNIGTLVGRKINGSGLFKLKTDAASSPRGMSSTELARDGITDTLPFLLESANPSQGRVRGKNTGTMPVDGKDKFYTAVYQNGVDGRTQQYIGVEFTEDGVPLEVRVGRHIETIMSIVSNYQPGKEMTCEDQFKNAVDQAACIAKIPNFKMNSESTAILNYSKIMEKGIGSYLQAPTEGYYRSEYL